MEFPTEKRTLTPDDAIDLHMHTTFSDGTWTPKQLLDHLVQEDFGLAAITDHDRPDTVDTLQQLAQEKLQPLLIGVEMSTVWQDAYMHQRKDELSGLLEMTDLLCFGFDPNPKALLKLAQDLWRRQQENTQEVYENLRKQGFRFDRTSGALANILEKPALRQPHELAALLRNHGYGKGEPSAGRILLESGCNYALNNLAEVVDAAHQDGGICILAHPGHKDGGFVTYDLEMLDKLRQEISLDGLEVYHSKHTPDQTEMYLEYAQRNNLLISTGSDSHGPDKPPIKYKAELCWDLLERLDIKIE